jgi:hypothetical protein
LGDELRCTEGYGFTCCKSLIMNEERVIFDYDKRDT